MRDSVAHAVPTLPCQTRSNFTVAVTVRYAPGGAGSEHAVRAPHDAVATPTRRARASPRLLTGLVPRPRGQGESRARSAAHARRSNRAVADQAPLCPLGLALRS